MQQEIPSLVKETVNGLDAQANVILFGSRARGDFHTESDWDFLILTPQETTVRYRDRIRDSLYMIELEHDEIISSVIENQEEWKKYIHSEFYENVSKEGIEVSSAKAR
ncbi:MAG: nucleotidyltransferase domain-containing protein [Bacteroidota bacterium]